MYRLYNEVDRGLYGIYTTEGEFLSDAPFFRLSLWTEFKLANCACVSGWSCLMNLDLRSLFLS